jgi:SAM-dependent methyltransferase
MKKPLDRITEAYFGELGETFADKVRNRIHWICENAVGENILDVGCSQGITSILLGREGKNVIGIDLLEESIQYANNLLSTEEEITKKYVQFKAANFIDFAQEKQTFDSIIFGEILEHITDPKRFIKMALNMLNPNGSLIITLPFGINDYFDHKKTYYLNDLLKFQDENIVIEEIKFFGKWIGAIVKRKETSGNNLEINDTLLSRLEKAFYDIERTSITSSKNKDKKIKTLEDKVKIATAEKEKLTAKSIADLKGKDQEISTLKEELSTKDVELVNRKVEAVKMNEDLGIKELEIVRKNNEIFSLNEELYKKENKILTLNEELNKTENKILILNEEVYKKDQLLKEQSDKVAARTSVLDHDFVDMKQNQELQDRIRHLEASYKKVKQQLEESRKMQKDVNAKLDSKDKELKKSKANEKKLNSLLMEVKKQATIFKKEKIKVQEDLLESYTKEEKLLKAHRTLMKRYKALSESKLGKFTLLYWGKRRQVFGGK